MAKTVLPSVRLRAALKSDGQPETRGELPVLRRLLVAAVTTKHYPQLVELLFEQAA